jgi:hypothetical protein
MPNNLNLYDPLWYANETLEKLRKNLGMARNVYRGFDRTPQDRGSVINISLPSSFVAQDAPSTAQDLTPGSVAITLNQWKEVKFSLTDKELSFTGEKIIEDHLEPAAYAIADAIDIALASEYKNIPWYATTTSPFDIPDLTNLRKIMFNNGVPMSSPLALMVDGTLEAEMLNKEAFNRADAAGQAGIDAQQRGVIGRKFGFNIFANQNVQTHVAGVSADSTGTLTGAHAAGATSIAVGGLTIGGTVKAGDTLVIAGHAQRYAVTANATADGGGAIAALAITPPLVKAYSNADVVTINLVSGVQNLAFGRGAFALATAPLSTVGNNLGARMEVVNDEISGISIRSRIWYEGGTSKVFVALDVLYGVKTLDPNKGVRLVV